MQKPWVVAIGAVLSWLWLVQGFCGLQAKDWKCVCVVSDANTGSSYTSIAYLYNQSKKDAEAICQFYEDEWRQDLDPGETVSCTPEKI